MTMAVSETPRRMQIRQGAIAVLTNMMAQPYPTLAGNRVYDSRSVDLQVDLGHAPKPSISIYTDTTKYAPVNPMCRGFAPFKVELQLIIEMSLSGWSDQVQTDNQMEELLDLMEEQVMRALFESGSDEMSAWHTMFTKILDVRSMRLSNSEYSVRLGHRDLVIDLEYSTRCNDISIAFPKLERMYANASISGGEVIQTRSDIE